MSSSPAYNNPKRAKLSQETQPRSQAARIYGCPRPVTLSRQQMTAGSTGKYQFEHILSLLEYIATSYPGTRRGNRASKECHNQ